ncbi:MAG: hypothetical protein ACE5FI_11250, partial [Anaerolineales bacterium]
MQRKPPYLKALAFVVLAVLLTMPVLSIPLARAGGLPCFVNGPTTGNLYQDSDCDGVPDDCANPALKQSMINNGDGALCGVSGGGATTAAETEAYRPPWWEGSDYNGESRVGPNPAEDFAVYCFPPGYVEVWQTAPPPPRVLARFPIGWAALDPAS